MSWIHRGNGCPDRKSSVHYFPDQFCDLLIVPPERYLASPFFEGLTTMGGKFAKSLAPLFIHLLFNLRSGSTFTIPGCNLRRVWKDPGLLIAVFLPENWEVYTLRISCSFPIRGMWQWPPSDLCQSLGRLSLSNPFPIIRKSMLLIELVFSGYLGIHKKWGGQGKSNQVSSGVSFTMVSLFFPTRGKRGASRRRMAATIRTAEMG